jgi:hypothetical protein
MFLKILRCVEGFDSLITLDFGFQEAVYYRSDVSIEIQLKQRLVLPYKILRLLYIQLEGNRSNDQGPYKTEGSLHKIKMYDRLTATSATES